MLARSAVLARCAPVVGLAMVVLASCATPGNPTAVESRAASEGVRLRAVAGPALAPDELFRKVSPSIVHISTEWAIGSGVLIDGGYVVTNAHVIVPFGAVDVSLPGEDATEDVPVVGVDFSADLALLGPIDVDAPAAVLGSVAQLEPGDDVFLLGYPSETEAAPTPAIAEGIVSRLRHVEEWDETFVQTDADIAGGQSGGALVNSSGQVIGISGASLDEAFALAISADDVVARLDQLREGGDDWQRLPDTGSLTGSVDATFDDAPPTLIGMVAADEDGLVSVELATDDGDIDDVGMYVYLDDGSSFVSRNVYEWLEDWEIEDGSFVDGETVLEPTSPGTYEFDVPGGSRGWIALARLDEGRDVTVTWSSSRELASLADPDGEREIEVGDEVEGIIEPLETSDVFTIDLDEGDEITIRATTGASDVAFTVLGPGEGADAARFDDFGGVGGFYVDDSFIGIGGLDAEATFEAHESGVHRIVVIDHYGQGAYKLSITQG